MTARGEDGYVLASALAVLLAISLVAVALVSTSVDGLHRIRRAEADAAAETTLRSAVLLLSSQLALDPRRRKLGLDEGEATIEVLGHTVEVRATWENAKIDVNLASPEDIDEALRDVGVDEKVRGEVRAAVQRHRGSEIPVQLLDDILLTSTDSDCFHSILTVFGGRSEYEPEARAAPARIGRPAAGARLSVEVWLPDEPNQGLAAVLLMTGDPAAPAEVLDWRRIRNGGKERCNA